MSTSGVYGGGDEFHGSFNIVYCTCQDPLNADDFVTVCNFDVIG